MDKDKVKNWLDEMSNYDINLIISFIRGIYNEKCDIEEELNKYKQAIDKIKKFSDENYDYEYRLFCEAIDEILEEIE